MSRASSARRHGDISKLIMAGYDVEIEESSSPLTGGQQRASSSSDKGGNSKKNPAFFVSFQGPENTIYERALFKVRVELPESYPFQSPSIGFEQNSVWHPNICFASGSVCLDVLNSLWTPLYSLANVFEQFLPYLLAHPNCADPLNSEAAAELEREKGKFEMRVKGILGEMMKRKGLEDAYRLSESPSLGKKVVEENGRKSEDLEPKLSSHHKHTSEIKKNSMFFTDEVPSSSSFAVEGRISGTSTNIPDDRINNLDFSANTSFAFSPDSSERCAVSPHSSGRGAFSPHSLKRISLGGNDGMEMGSECDEARTLAGLDGIGWGMTGLDDDLAAMDAEFD